MPHDPRHFEPLWFEVRAHASWPGYTLCLWSGGSGQQLKLSWKSKANAERVAGALNKLLIKPAARYKDNERQFFERRTNGRG